MVLVKPHASRTPIRDAPLTTTCACRQSSNPLRSDSSSKGVVTVARGVLRAANRSKIPHLHREGEIPKGRVTLVTKARITTLLRIKNGAPGMGRRPKPSCQLPLVHGDVLGGVDGPDVIRSRANQPVVVQLFNDMRRPTADARDREHRGEQIDIDSKGVIGRG